MTDRDLALFDRRHFLSTSLAAGASLALAPAGALGLSPQAATRFVPPDRPLNLAFIGIGNRGKEMLKTFAATDLVKVTAFAQEVPVPLGLKVAVTVLAALIVTVQVPVPVQAPLQPAKVELAPAAAVSVRVVPPT